MGKPIFIVSLHLRFNFVIQFDENLKNGCRKKNGGFVRLDPDLFIGW
jgi:hypothetical protein